VYSGLALESVSGQISRLFDEFKRELGRMEGVDTVELDNTILEEMEFHVGVLVAMSTDIHREDVVVDLDRVSGNDIVSKEGRVSLNVVQLGHYPILGKVHILSVLDLLREISVIVRVTAFRDLRDRFINGKGRSEGDVRVVLHLKWQN